MRKHRLPVNDVDFLELRATLRDFKSISGADVHQLGDDIVEYRNTEYFTIEDHSIFTFINSFAINSYSVTANFRKYVNFFFLLNGNLIFDRHGRLTRYEKPIVIVTQDSHAPMSFARPAGLTTRFIGVHVPRDVLTDTYGLRVDRLPGRMHPIFDPRFSCTASTSFTLSVKSIVALDAMDLCPFSEPLRSIFLRGKAEELLCEVIHRLNQTATGDRSPSIFSTSARRESFIEAAARIYDQEIGRMPSVDEIARRVGLNRNALNDGFKDLFGMSPGEYGRRARLLWARQQLAIRHLTLKEVAGLTGYADASAFSRAYSAVFGHAPLSGRE